MGRVQGGARAAFATPSWGPSRMTYFIDFKYSTMATSHFFSKFPPNGNDIDSFA